ncbi:hypothetical protein JDV09_12380 [Mycobacterium sp. Y57]|uniref:hypothetical protein n=1 Tax=Mycolicibacterium xanthum TaxID=2796469 RepID=UPI001C864F3F|nr:hypothetical protein [Mycolicibacterium xanthum]MBX7432897.1 hypothetical protein [Mycolicibacterium xanthum]
MVAPYTADEARNWFVVAAPVSLDVFDHGPSEGEGVLFGNFSSPLSSELNDEIDGAAEWLGVTPEEIVLAALGRTFGRARGDGVVAVDVTGGHRWQCHPVSLICAAGLPMGPTEMLQGAHNALGSAAGQPSAKSEILLSIDAADAAAAPATGHALQVRVRRIGGSLHSDWIYDTARLDRYSVEEMAEQFGPALIGITSDAATPL